MTRSSISGSLENRKSILGNLQSTILKGDTGVGISDIKLNADYTLTIYLTDGTEYTTESIRGEQGLNGDKGDKGDTPVIIATKTNNVTTVFADGIQIATILDGTKGDKGDTGIQGLKGDTPVITATKAGKVTTISADGTLIATINDGSDGEDYTLTATDKQDIASLVVGMEIDDGAGDGDTDKTWSADKITDELANAGTVKDVTVDGTSIVDSNGTADIPIASSKNFGVIKTKNGGGTTIDTVDNTLIIYRAGSSFIKAGAALYMPIVPANQHESTFYGLAKAAGDTTQSQSENAVGTYTLEAKQAIRTMLGISNDAVPYELTEEDVNDISDAVYEQLVNVVNISGTDPTITAEENTRYICGELLSLNFTPCQSGICNIIFTSGSTLTVLTLPSTVKLPDWFEVETNRTYEISIMDGVYGTVTSWEV